MTTIESGGASAVSTAHTSRAATMQLAAEVSLAAMTCAAAFGLIRLFTDSSFLPEVLASAIVGHVLAAVARRRGWSVGTTAGIAAVGAAVVLPWLLLSDTTAYGIPTSATVDTARQAVRDAWAQFGDVVAPTPVLLGFVVAAAVGVWGMAFLADTAAFRANGVVEAMVPSATLFVFGSALGADRSRALCTALFLAALLAFWLTARAHQQLSSPQWMARDEGRGTRSLLRSGATLGALAILAALVVGPNLPGADAQALIPWRASDRDEGGSRVTVSPLVDIRTRIVDQADVEVFRVKSDVRSYWRLTALETFDGRIWSSSRRYRRADGALGSAVREDLLPITVTDQSFEIRGLSSIWLPAAFRPVGINGTPARYDDESGSLLTEDLTTTGLTYTVESAVPTLAAAELAAAGTEIPDDIADTYLTLPGSFPQSVRALAATVVNGATTPYQQARRLQDFFRTGEFVYDLNVERGHSGGDLERFLFETRRGYCEQFAGAYAAMARAIGLPSRVGVGFTPGDEIAPGLYSVRGYHGHAWPEVFLAGFGWIAFEPTPGRGIPGGEGYTGVPEAQASPVDPNTATTLATTTTAAVAAGPGASTSIPAGPQNDENLTAGEPEQAPSAWPKRLLVVASLLVLIPILWTSLVAGLTRLRRWRRRSAAAGAGASRVEVAWDEAGEALTRAGVVPRPWETPDELAERTPIAAADVQALATITTSARYAAEDLDPTDELVTSAVLTAREVEKQANATLDGRARLRALLDPRRPR